MAVRLDIRPRLTLRDAPVAKVRRPIRLPPLTFPAVGYWLAMGALTYFFAHLGESPLETASAALVTETAPVAAYQPPLPSEPLLSPEPALQPPPQPEPEPQSEPQPEPEPELALGPAPVRDRAAPHYRPLETKPVAPEAPAPQPEPPRVALSFPEFSDSSRPRARERASGGPRIDADLFGGGADKPRPDGTSDAPRAPESDPSAASVASSCEAAIARNNEQIEIGGSRGPADVTRDAYASILENGRYLAGCSIPERTVFEVCVAVKNGRAVGVTVSSNPPSAAVNGCVRRAVSRLKFPANSRLDVTHTRFDRAR